MILVPPMKPKFAIGLGARVWGTSGAASDTEGPNNKTPGAVPGATGKNSLTVRLAS